MSKQYYLLKNGNRVGNAIVFEDGNCVYQIWAKMSFTYNSTLTKLKKKYKLEKQDE